MCFHLLRVRWRVLISNMGKSFIKDSMGYEHMITHLNTLNSELEKEIR